MKLLFLGTGAADWDIKSPERQEGFRRYTSTLVDGSLLIDPGPCVLEALQTFGADRSKIKYIINTHSHSDHYNKETVESLEKDGAEHFVNSNGDGTFYDPYYGTTFKVEDYHLQEGRNYRGVDFVK